MVSGGVGTFWLWGLGSGLGWLGVWAQLVGWCWLADVRFNGFHRLGLCCSSVVWGGWGIGGVGMGLNFGRGVLDGDGDDGAVCTWYDV